MSDHDDVLREDRDREQMAGWTIGCLESLMVGCGGVLAVLACAILIGLLAL